MKAEQSPTTPRRPPFPASFSSSFAGSVHIIATYYTVYLFLFIKYMLMNSNILMPSMGLFTLMGTIPNVYLVSCHDIDTEWVPMHRYELLSDIHRFIHFDHTTKVLVITTHDLISSPESFWMVIEQWDKINDMMWLLTILRTHCRIWQQDTQLLASRSLLICSNRFSNSTISVYTLAA